jgi:hypothetical protein
MTDGWTVVATYAQVYEAEMAKAQLESAGIPAQVLGEHIGVFGPGWSGMAIRGVRVAVPAGAADAARGLLEGYEVEGEDGDEEGEDEDDWGPGATRDA